MLSNDTYLNILVSYAFCGKNEKMRNLTFGSAIDKRTNLMIDSGAYSLFCATTNKLNWLTLDNYCKFLDTYGQYVEKYVALDVINDDKASKNNYETMLHRGHNPMYVFTNYDTDFEYLKHAVAQNPHVCVAGGLLANRPWLHKRYQDVYKYTGGLIHALAFVKFPDMLQLPIHSVDSSSWIQGGLKYGHLKWWDGGIKSVPFRDVIRKKRPMPPYLIGLLDKYKVTLKDFETKQYHHQQQSIENMLSIIAYIEYQKYCKSHGLNLFLAAANPRDIRNILFIDEHLTNKNLTYEKFKSLGPVLG